MRLVPEDTFRKIEFFRPRVGPWAEHADQIGTSPEIVATLAEQVAEAEAAFAAQLAAQRAARGATARLQAALDAMSATGASITSQIRGRRG